MKWGYQINPNTAAENGQFFGIAGRPDEVQLIVIRSREVEVDLNRDQTIAQRFSGLMGNKSEGQSSWHTTIGSDLVLHEIPTEWTCLHLKNWNSRTIAIEVAICNEPSAHSPADHQRHVTANLARVVAWMCQRHNLPPQLVTSLERARAGDIGVIAHSTLDPDSGSSPLPDFAWSDLFEQTQELLDREAPIVGIGDRGAGVLAAQRDLESLGYGHLIGIADGIADSPFDDAVRAYERDQGLPETGLWSEPVLDLIGDSLEAIETVTISASVGSGGTNRANDVKAVKAKLSELNFLIDGRPLEHSIRLFQAAKDGDQRINDKDGRVDPGSDTLAWLNASNAPRWVQMPAGSQAEGFKSRERTQLNDDHGWGTSWLAETLRAAGAVYKSSYIDDQPAAPLIWSNDASPKRGGDSRDHAGHEAGMQLDLVLPPGSAASSPLKVDHSGYDREATRSILRSFHAQGNIKSIYLNDSVLQKEGLCKYASGHDNHIHVHINPPKQSMSGTQPISDDKSGLQVDWVFIGKREGFETEGYVPKDENSQAIGQSGVTIGSGFDLGHHSPEYLSGLGAPDHLVTMLRPYFGLRKSSAIQYLNAHPLTMQHDDVLIIDKLVKADKAKAIEKQYNSDSSVSFSKIPPAAQTIIVSVLFQYGRASRVPRFWQFATDQQWSKVVAELRDFGDIYAGRRRLEADYLSRELANEQVISESALPLQARDLPSYSHTLISGTEETLTDSTPDQSFFEHSSTKENNSEDGLVC